MPARDDVPRSPDALARAAEALRGGPDPDDVLGRGLRDAVMVVAADGRVVAASPGLSALLGLPPAALVGARPPWPLDELAAGGDGPACDRGAPCAVRRPDGGEVLVTVERRVLLTADGAIVGRVVAVRDVTAEVRAERAAARRLAALEAFSRTVPIAVWAHGPQGEVAFTNDGWEALTGQPAADSAGDGWLAIVHPDDLERATAVWDDLVHGRTDDLRVIYRIRHLVTGEERTIAEHARTVRDVDGSPHGAVGASWDVTEEARAEAELRRHVAELDALTRTMPAAVWRVSPGGEVLMATAYWSVITGQDATDARGSGWTAAVHPDEREQVAQAFAEAVARGEEWHREYRILHPTGEVRWVLDRGTPVRDDAGRVASYVGTTVDVTATHAAAARLGARAAQQQAVAELGRRALARDCSTLQLEHLAAEALGRVLGTPYASVLALREDGAALEIVASDGVPFDALGREVPRHGSLAGRALDEDGVFWSSDPAADGWTGGAGQFADLGIESGIAAPIHLHDRTFGVLAAYALADRSFSPDDQHFVASVAHIVGSAIERARDEERIWLQAHHDIVTHLPNRSLFRDRLQHALERARRRGTMLSVLFLDLDRFKNVNDSLGHAAGDELLRAVAARLAGAVRTGDTVARLGGDEFVILADDVESLAQAHAIATRIVETLREPFALAGDEVWATVSVGYAVTIGGEASVDDLLRDADAAMYRAKELGRDRAEPFDEEMRRIALDRLRTEAALRRALEPDARELLAHFQPIVALADGALVGFEALVRWRQPGGDLLPAAQFVPVAEETGLVAALGERVLAQAAAAVAAWNAVAQDARPLQVHVNLAVQQVVDPTLVDHVAALLARWEIAPGQLVLELTETSFLRDATAAARTIDGLAAIGVRVLLDDFGVGFSSIAHLDFAIAGLKIDRAVVARAFAPGGDLSTVEGIVRLAAAKRIPAVIAEGVEEPAMVAPLRAVGCPLGQGYGFARPLAPGQALALAQARSRFPVGR